MRLILSLATLLPQARAFNPLPRGVDPTPRVAARHLGYDPRMDRALPAGLTNTQRNVLSDFYAGRISAGHLMQHLGIETQARTERLPPVRQGVRDRLQSAAPAPRPRPA